MNFNGLTIEQMIKAVQLSYGITADGKAGPQTWAAIYADVVHPPSDTPITPDDIALVDERSEKNIATLLPEVQPYARSLIHAAQDHGIKLIVTSGSRSYAQQDALYAQGRTKPGNIVTNARGGYSSHNFATAFDCTIFNDGQPVWESPKYHTVGVLGKNLGLSWGGDWQNEDQPHFYLKPDWAKGMSENQMMTELRRRHTTGERIFT